MRSPSSFLLRWLRNTLLALSSLACAFVWAQTCSVPGQAGTIVTLAAQPNSFFPGTAGAAASATSLSIGAGTGVSRDIFPGDLLLVIQMQGADFNSTDTNGYGDGTVNAGVTQTVAFGVAGYAGGVTGTNYSAGTYEWAVAASQVNFAAGGTLQLSAPLQNAYLSQGGNATTFKRAYQVVRVPQYARATLSANLTVQGWNGSTGGILAIDSAGDLSLAGFSILGNGRGFRGGGSLNSTPHNTTCTTTWNPPPAACQHYRHLIEIPGADGTTGYWGGSKGEGCSGTPGRLYSAYNATLVAGGVGSDGYPDGDMGRGAPCNAGGGGNAHNSGGGGGGNGGAGGNGGNSWNSSTTGNVGHRIGAFGGSPGSGIGATRLSMGGGGGAGDLGGNASASPTGSGGAGGALVILHASRIVGGGATINVNGEDAPGTVTTDGAGGGGAGGTVMVKANSLAGGLTVSANGGAGGNYGVAGAEQDGAGGGGAGGIAITNVAITFGATGGAAGVSSSTNCAPASAGADCGQRAGAAGTGGAGYAVFAPGVRTGYECLPALTVTKSTTTPTITSATGATASYVINISNAGGGARFVRALDWTLPPGWTLAASPVPAYAYSPAGAGFLPAGAETIAATNASTWAVGAAPLASAAAGDNTLTWSGFAMPPVRAGVASSVTISFVASIPDTATVGSYHNPAGTDFLDPTRPATTATVAQATNNGANRSGQSYGSTVYSQYNGAAATGVAGSHYSGLEAGPAAENVTLIPNLRIVKSVSAGTSTAGQTFSYTIGVQNIGRPIADQVFAATQATNQSATALASNPLSLTDTLPAGFTATVVTPTPAAWICAGAGSALVTCAASAPTAAAIYPIAQGTPVAPAAVGTITLTVLPRTDSCTNGSVTNTVTLMVSSLGETSVADNVATASHATRCGANLQVTKTNGTTSVTAGQTTSYTVTLANLGPSSADGATVTDTVSAGLSSCTVTACSPAGGATCPAAGQWPNMLGAGLALPGWPAASTLTFTLQCTVTATGLP